MKKHYSLIIWDWNGTLIDDVEASLMSVNDMLLRRSMKPITLIQYYEYVDTPIAKFYEHIFDLNTISFDTIASEFDSGYELHLAADPVMDGARQALDSFSHQGKGQVVVSAAYRDKIIGKMNDFSLRHYFDEVIAFDNYYAGDKSRLALDYMTAKGIDTRDAVVIGDCVSDYMTSRTLGCDCILTTRGHQSRWQTAGLGVPVIDSLGELSNYVC